jgi:hypothetical protein
MTLRIAADGTSGPRAGVAPERFPQGRTRQAGEVERSRAEGHEAARSEDASGRGRPVALRQAQGHGNQGGGWLRTSISLYVHETTLQLIGVLPVCLSILAATAALPDGATLLGGQGPPVIVDAILLSGPGMLVGSLVSAGLLTLLFLLAAPLLLAGTIRSLGSPDGPEALRLVGLGARRYPMFLLLHVLFVALCAGGSVLLVWTAGPLRGALAAFVLVGLLAILRDMSAVVLCGQERIPDCLARIPALVARRPLPVIGGAILQAAAAWLLVLGAVRLQLELHAETVARALVLGLVVQSLVLARCLVRCAWLRALVRHDS